MTLAHAGYAPSGLAGRPVPRGAPRENPLLNAAFAFFTVLILSVSPFALTAFGFDYTDAGGTVLTKFHPATLFLGFLLVLVAAGTGDPLGAIVRWCRETPAAFALAGATAIAVAHAAMITKIPFTPIVETFIPAAALLILLRYIPEQRGRTLALLIHAILFANALIALGEYLTGWRLTPFVIDGEVLAYEWRSTALLGHPLANAMITGTYIIVLAVGGGRDLPLPLRLASMLTCLASMTAFGGRGALVLVLVLLGVLAARKVLGVLMGASLDTRFMMAAIAAVPLAGAGLLILAHGGFFERLLDRFAYDTGSAQTRWDMLALFSHIPLQDLLFAPDPRQVMTWQTAFGLERGIESFWLSMILSYGVAVSLLVFAGLFAHCWTVVQRSRPGAAWALAYFIGVSTMSLSLGGKSGILTIATLIVLVLLRPSTQPRIFHGRRAYLAMLR